ncbi:Coatomer, alpha subunit [Basidiobolus meristosporus CBS 931.73]|uniref:Coatomer subunit alpha n=1 Tax=Basidiobolus meristosporus CBS 931.73 TaxID=1314790 RepID=A0A1Y1Y327_9FUNG|nr:Coatomer, alpha subunit [Basidiobolus meristosporus CBS 931.73]|eukprot:ORX92400.1 Coatomer, alpha subunit [Basidiobolus meristosporus CBS 931.73]
MLFKWESTSTRVKGLAFHPRRPWVLTSLHSGGLELWDYRTGALLERFEEHTGPVRGVSFHPTKELFVSGGDDMRVKVWDVKTRRCLFTLSGHSDYIRTVFFHPRFPWIVSASDDLTIRIWNWQSRACIAVLAGHTHYVMCAQFHPTEDLIASASLDQTVRIWDTSGLRSKNVAPVSVLDGGMASGMGQQADVVADVDVTVRFVLEGHSRGVNWVSFHPSQALLVSGGDDKQIRVWRFNVHRAWETEVYRGHTDNVSSVLFHPHHGLIVSCGEDMTIRVWDTDAKTLVQCFSNTHNRFWALCSHPKGNLFASGHDGGLAVFKLNRERPAWTMHEGSLFYVRENHIRAMNYATGKDAPLVTIKRLNTYTAPKTVTYNNAEKAFLITTQCESPIYELYRIPKGYTGGALIKNEVLSGSCSAAVFLSRNRFAVLNQPGNTIDIKDLSNATTATINFDRVIRDISYSPGGGLMLFTDSCVILYHVPTRRALAELSVDAVKYAVWAPDMSMVALLAKHSVTLCTKDLVKKCQARESSRVKSGAFDSTGVFIYNTLDHIKFLLFQGDHGIIRTVGEPVYLLRSEGTVLHILDRKNKPDSIVIDPTEYQFKLALIEKNLSRAVHFIRDSSLVGKGVVAYLQQLGYPEIAMFFVDDETDRFELALDAGNIDAALRSCQSIDKYGCWAKLSDEALKHGNRHVAELAYRRIKRLDRLSFLYLVTGDLEKINSILAVAEQENGAEMQYNNALLVGNVEARIKILVETNQLPLAYLTAKSHGLDTKASQILMMANMAEVDIQLPTTSGRFLPTPSPLLSRPTVENWPLLSSSKGAFENIVKGIVAGIPAGNDELLAEHRDLSNENMDDKPDDPTDWGIEEICLDEVREPVRFVMPSSGIEESDVRCRHSSLAVDHIACGFFDTAMNLLNSQSGVVNFAPLKPLFLTVFRTASTLMSMNPSIVSIRVPIRRSIEETRLEKSAPGVIFTLANLTNRFHLASKLTSDGKFEDAIAQFKGILHTLVLTTVDQAHLRHAEELLSSCREYIVGLQMERVRQNIRDDDKENVKRILELSAYFTHCDLQNSHKQLSLRLAMTLSFRYKNFRSASSFAGRLLDSSPPSRVVAQARQVQSVSDKASRDEILLNYDPFKPLLICGSTYTPIHDMDRKVECPYCHSSYHLECQGKLCTTCDISQIGASATGLRILYGPSSNNKQREREAIESIEFP